MLKIDLHIHTNKDPEDRGNVKFSPMEIIDLAAMKGFDAIAITHHLQVYTNKQLTAYAKKKGILLIPGCEHRIGKKDILIYNISEKERQNILTFEDLKKLRKKRKDLLVIAPHPFYLKNSLGNRLIKNLSFIDAIELSYFYTRFLNRNKKAIDTALKYNKPLVGNSDSHFLYQFGLTFSLVKARKNVKSIISAIKKNDVAVVTRPLSALEFARVILRMIFISMPTKLYNKLKQKLRISRKAYI